MTTVTVFEQQRVLLAPDGPLTLPQLTSLQRFHARDGGGRYFELCYRGIRLSSYVGILRVGELTLEILPKTDNQHPVPFWRDRLFDLLGVLHEMPLFAPTAADLRTRPRSVLEHYLYLFATQIEDILRRGLVQRYRTQQTNATALSGKLLFTEQLRYNAVHRERFFVERTTYDARFVHHQLLRQALELAVNLTEQTKLAGRLTVLLSRFPELPPVTVRPAVFAQLTYDRKTRSYRPAMEIVRLLLLNYHPDVVGGRENVLALLFDMNLLWERFVGEALRRCVSAWRIRAQLTHTYWRSSAGSAVLRPDFVLRRGEETMVVDAKWKVGGGSPSAQDLRQLYVYADQFGASRAVLVYPGVGAGSQVQGKFVNKPGVSGRLVYVPVVEGIGEWMGLVGEGVVGRG